MLEVQQQRADARQTQFENRFVDQFKVQQKQLDTLQKIVQTIAANNNPSTTAPVVTEPTNQRDEVDPEEAQPAPTKYASSEISEFKKVCNTSFKGTEDPSVALNWLAELEDHFEALGMDESKRVACAQLQLQLNAHDWWDVQKRAILCDGQTTKITWATFRKAFEEEFLPPAVRQEKENEFMQLRQGNMIVRQYASEFNRLAKFASALLPDAASPTFRNGPEAFHSCTCDRS